MIRKIDEVGRVVLPAEYRRELGIKENDELRLILCHDGIKIEKPYSGCVFCGSAINLVGLGALFACRTCIERLYEAEEGDALYLILPE